MADETEKIDFVKRRLNSLMSEIMEGPKGVGNTDPRNLEYRTLQRLIELHEQINPMFPNNKFLPKPKTIEEVNKDYQYAQGYYVKTTIREIADALHIT